MTLPEPPPEVVDVASHGQDRHHLGGGGDVESALARIAVGRPAEAERDRRRARSFMSTARFQVTRRASIVVRVAVQDRGIEHGGEQVVGGADRVDVAGEVEVEVLHGNHLGEPAAGGASLDSEHGTERGLPQAEDGALADHGPGPRSVRPRSWSCPRRPWSASSRRRRPASRPACRRAGRSRRARSSPCSGRRARSPRARARSARRSRRSAPAQLAGRSRGFSSSPHDLLAQCETAADPTSETSRSL